MVVNLNKIPTLSKAKVKKWKPSMSNGEVNRWKREGSVQSMFRRKGRSRKGNWGTYEQRWWQAGEPRHPFHH